MKKKLFLLTAIASMAFATIMAQNVPSNVPLNGLVGYWGFSGNANDYSGNGNNGIVNGATLATDRFGSANSAYSFNGTSNSISFSQLFVFHSPGDATLSIWINKSAIGNSQSSYLFSSLNTIDENRFNFFLNQGTYITIDYRQPYTLHPLMFYTPFPNDAWEHVVYTRINNVYSFYLNGQYINAAVDNTPNLPTAIGWTLGADPSNANDYTGKLDDLGLWNRALTQQEITNLYDGTVGINEIENNNVFNISPNPTTEQFTITLDKLISKGTINIYNALGENILNENIFNELKKEINLKNISSGIYLVQLYDGEKTFAQKVIIQ